MEDEPFLHLPKSIEAAHFTIIAVLDINGNDKEAQAHVTQTHVE
jgi:hypothetical protein